MPTPTQNMDSNDTQKKHPPALKGLQQFNVDIMSGVMTGIFCSGLFNPWDRALYLSIKNKRSFLLKDNFKSPYHGVTQAIVQRAFLGSIYFILQSQLKNTMYPYWRGTLGFSESTTQFFLGLSAGSMSGLLTNSISAVKYHTWGQENRSFFSSAREMQMQGGLTPFLKGTTATMCRDMVFGGTYELMRHLLYYTLRTYQEGVFNTGYDMKFLCDATAAAIATVISGPLNYARTIQYATSPALKPPTIRSALQNVWNESKNQGQKPFERMRFFQQRFGVGWGSARVALGMPVGQKVYDTLREQLNGLNAS